MDSNAKKEKADAKVIRLPSIKLSDYDLSKTLGTGIKNSLIYRYIW
jgi:hypothetical protein